MKKLFLFLLLMPALAWASVSGMDDENANISPITAQRLDDAITTYYQHPSVQKVDTVLDILNNSDVLRKKSAWPPAIGFLTIVFRNNKEHLFDWMSRYDYNEYAQSVFVAALLHAQLKETALVFAQAHQWQALELRRLRNSYDTVNLEHMDIRFPGHIDTLWGAFFASGDPLYVNEIINVLFQKTMPESTLPGSPSVPSEMLKENKKLAEATLRRYAPLHVPVRQALQTRIAAEKDDAKRHYLENILGETPPASEGGKFAVSWWWFLGAGLLVLMLILIPRKAK